MTAAAQPLVQVRDLSVFYESGGGFLGGPTRRVRALHNVDLDIPAYQTFGVVGESGCGKTTLGRALLRLVKPASGQITIDGVEVLALSGAALRALRREMQIIFQNPIASLSPRLRVRDVVAEPLQTHTPLRGQLLNDRVLELLRMVGMDENHLDRFPHALSGGQAQRVAIARALALNPKFLVLDEPTSALDVSVQAQILNLLQQLQGQFNLTYLLISHDLAVVQYISQRLAVMYLGEIVEEGPPKAIFGEARHPYTQALLSATPVLDPHLGRRRIILSGVVPSAADPPPGCPFHTRCPQVVQQCREVNPPPTQIDADHWASCHLLTK